MSAERKPFVNRNDAGERLANQLIENKSKPDIIVALPRGGIPVAIRISEKIGIPVYLLIVKKIGHPVNPEYAIGALSETGVLWSNDITASSVYKQNAMKEAQQKVAELKLIFPEQISSQDVRGKHVLIVDDGAATGLTVQLAIRSLKKMGALKLSLALPVCPFHTYQKLNKITDELHVLIAPQNFRGVGAYYEYFPQLTDEEAVSLLVAT